jgi:hypothetical protein
VLLASGQIGLHEQTRLQSYITGFMDGGFKTRFSDFGDKELGGLLGPLRDAILDLAAALEDAWIEFATKEVLRLDLPNEQLRLREDVPNAPGAATLFPNALDQLNNGPLLDLLQKFKASGPTSVGTGSTLWTDLSQRMRYILVLFRSRQFDQILLNEPFSPQQRDDIKAGKMPVPPPPL